MKSKSPSFANVYLSGLRGHLRQSRRKRARAPLGLGHRAVAAGLETLDVARIHEQALRTVLASNGASGSETKLIERAGAFFAQVITPVQKTHHGAHHASQLKHRNAELEQRTLDLANSVRRLEEERARRLLVEQALRKSEQHHLRSLEESRDLQEQLRQLSHQILSVQEEERKRISRELHDQIAQTLTGINLRLASLKVEATINAKGLQRKIASTQRLVERSVEVVHRFARDLRPTVLDDLGLIPALHSFIKDFSRRTGIRIELTAFSSKFLQELDGAQRTVLYRVAQEALTNVARHAHASHVKVNLRKFPGAIEMTIADNGKGFAVERLRVPKADKRLGVLGMRERLQMVGGEFSIQSIPCQGTSIQARIPVGNGRGGRQKAA